MCSLDEILERVKLGQPVHTDWLMLMNVYFRGGYKECQEWAKKNGLVVTYSDIIEQTATSVKFNTVTFWVKEDSNMVRVQPSATT